LGMTGVVVGVGGVVIVGVTMDCPPV